MLSTSNFPAISGKLFMHAFATNYEKKSASLGNFAPIVAFSPFATCL